jgi:hypothetical protein
VISFNYSDQSQFPPDSLHLNFDCEAVFHFQDSLYLFSKNRGASAFCRMYRLPDLPGNYTAELIDSFNTQHWITSADISPDGKNVVLLSEAYIWLLGNYGGTDFFGGTALHLSMDASQKEGIVFVSDSEVYITEDMEGLSGGKLYYLDLGPWLSGIGHRMVPAMQLMVSPNPAADKFCVFVCNAEKGRWEADLYNCTGQVLIRKIFNPENDSKPLWFNTSSLQSGTYLLRLQHESGLPAISTRVVIY